MIWVMILGGFLLIFLGVPVAFAMGAAALLFILVEGIPISMVAQQFFSNTQSFTFLAIPFFILAGNLMVQGNVAQRIIDLADSLVRQLPGGLGLVSVLTSMGMAGVSGSSVADASATGSVLIPSMKRKGYSASFSASINAASSVVGIIIPPSSTMIIIAWLGNLSVAQMFLAGAIPGILIGIAYFIVTIGISIKRGYPREKMTTLKEIAINVVRSFWALVLPILLLYVILAGIATATEAAALSALYAFVVAFFIYRELDLKKTWVALRDTVYSTAVVMMIICTAAIFTWVMIREGIPTMISDLLLGMGLEGWQLLFVMVCIMLLAGMVLEVVPNLFIFLPIFMPIAMDIGMDPIHFAIVMLVAFALGLFTPPIGVTLFISCHLANVGIEKTIKDLIPYFIAGIVIVFAVAYIPQLTLWLPSLFY
ncbi:TRAP transporter large permease [Virgibacillus kimchii]